MALKETPRAGLIWNHWGRVGSCMNRRWVSSGPVGSVVGGDMRISKKNPFGGGTRGIDSQSSYRQLEEATAYAWDDGPCPFSSHPPGRASSPFATFKTAVRSRYRHRIPLTLYTYIYKCARACACVDIIIINNTHGRTRAENDEPEKRRVEPSYCSFYTRQKRTKLIRFTGRRLSCRKRAKRWRVHIRL